jgi:quinol-cytochrome oxidoreductase complex cytochrome b subunit
MPFYGILKTIPHKAGGILTMAFTIIIFFFVPLIYQLKQSVKNYIVYFLNKLLLSNNNLKSTIKKKILLNVLLVKQYNKKNIKFNFIKSNLAFTFNNRLSVLNSINLLNFK